MKENHVRVRFAPSPTGDLHIGNARTALYNWLFARQQGGKFILRIEDTDPGRSTARYTAGLLRDLRWLGIDWDEGPGKEGACGPYLQSQRQDIYRRCLADLIEKNLVYPCFCTERQLESERQQLLAARQMPRYMGKCADLKQEERDRFLAAGCVPAYRFRVRGGVIAFDDILRGSMQFYGEAIGDFIVMRSNGMPAYNFAVVLDDHLMEISHVIRGEDHLSNTASQMLLYEALGWEPPRFCHHALILGADHQKLSKRHGSVSVGAFRKEGYMPEALVNYLALLGNSFGEGKEICRMEEVVSLFDIRKLGKSGAVFDQDKLNWFNNHYLRQAKAGDLRKLILPQIRRAGIKDVPSDKIDRFIELIRPNIGDIREVRVYLGLISEDAFSLDPDAKSILQEKKSIEVIREIAGFLESVREGESGYMKRAIAQASRRTGLKGRALYLPVRAALTGMIKGPELDALFDFLGRDSMARRLDKVGGLL